MSFLSNWISTEKMEDIYPLMQTRVSAISTPSTGFLFIYCISAFVISYTVDSDRAIQIWSDVSEISSFLIGSSSQESGYRSLSFPKQMDSSFPFVIVKDKMNYVSVIFCAALLACLNILLLISMQCLGSQWRSAWRAVLCFY
jgi:biotin transporter BioY